MIRNQRRLKKAELSDTYRSIKSIMLATQMIKQLKGKEERFEDTKVVIRIRKSKKNKQHNGQKKKDKRTNNDLQNIHIKLKIE